MKPRMQGVTLIELMIVIVVVAILASIAVPSYRNYLIRTNRTEATTALLQLRSAQEKFFLQNNSYITTTAGMTAAQPAGLGIPGTTPGGKYAITIAAGATPTSYTAVATPQGTQASDDPDCQLMSIDQDGQRISSPSATVCWR